MSIHVFFLPFNVENVEGSSLAVYVEDRRWSEEIGGRRLQVGESRG